MRIKHTLIAGALAAVFPLVAASQITIVMPSAQSYSSPVPPGQGGGSVTGPGNEVEEGGSQEGGGEVRYRSLGRQAGSNPFPFLSF